MKTDIALKVPTSFWGPTGLLFNGQLRYLPECKLSVVRNCPHTTFYLEVKNEWISTSFFPYIFMQWYLSTEGPGARGDSVRPGIALQAGTL